MSHRNTTSDAWAGTATPRHWTPAPAQCDRGHPVLTVASKAPSAARTSTSPLEAKSVLPKKKRPSSATAMLYTNMLPRHEPTLVKPTPSAMRNSPRRRPETPLPLPRAAAPHLVVSATVAVTASVPETRRLREVASYWRALTVTTASPMLIRWRDQAFRTEVHFVIGASLQVQRPTMPTSSPQVVDDVQLHRQPPWLQMQMQVQSRHRKPNPLPIPASWHRCHQKSVEVHRLEGLGVVIPPSDEDPVPCNNTGRALTACWASTCPVARSIRYTVSSAETYTSNPSALSAMSTAKAWPSNTCSTSNSGASSAARNGQGAEIRSLRQR